LVADLDLLGRTPPLAGSRDDGHRPALRVRDVRLLPCDRDADGLAADRHLVGLGEIARALADFEYRHAVGFEVHAEEQAARLVESDAARACGRVRPCQKPRRGLAEQGDREEDVERTSLRTHAYPPVGSSKIPRAGSHYLRTSFVVRVRGRCRSTDT